MTLVIGVNDMLTFYEGPNVKMSGGQYTHSHCNCLTSKEAFCSRHILQPSI